MFREVVSEEAHPTQRQSLVWSQADSTTSGGVRQPLFPGIFSV